MNLITPKYNYSSYNAEYYYFKKESDSNFLLFEILKTDWYNITIYQTEKDEYLEIGKKKKNLIISICVGVALLIIMIASLIYYKVKQVAKKKNETINNQPLMNKK